MDPSQDLPEPRPLTVVSAASYAVLHFVGMMVVYAILVATGGEDVDSSWVHVTVASLVAVLACLYLALSRHAPGEGSAAAVGLTAPRGREWAIIGVAVVFGVALVPVAAELTARLAAIWPAGQVDAEAEEQTRRILASDTPARWIANGVLVTLVPFLEEALYRGLLQRRLVGLTPVRALLAVAFFYVIGHSDPRAMPATLLLALGLGLIRLVASTTWASAAAHVVHAALPFTLVLLAGGADLGAGEASPEFLPVELVLGGAAVAAVASFVLWKMRRPSLA